MGMLAKEGTYGKLCKLTTAPDRWGDVSVVFETGATKDVKANTLIRAVGSQWNPWKVGMLAKEGAYGKLCKLVSIADNWGDVSVVFETGAIKDVKANTLIRAVGSQWNPWKVGMLAKEGAYGKLCKLTSVADNWGDVSVVFETGAIKDVKANTLIRAVGSNSAWDPWKKGMVAKKGAYGKLCQLSSDPDQWGDVNVVFETYLSVFEVVSKQIPK
jgi:hypothetical protein